MNNKKALIGYTGFVGSNILNQDEFDYLYNSKNIEEIQDLEFDLIVCSGAYGAKRKADKEPERDFNSIKRLMNNLEKVKTKKFILISTIDIYPNPSKVDENTPIEINDLAPYGKNRRILELFAERFFNTTIIRLPTIFGKGLKKNIIYDLLNDTYVEMIHPDGMFQFYYLENVWSDINKALENNINILNIATEPVSATEIGKVCFGIDLTRNHVETRAPYYNMYSKYGKLWNSTCSYLYSKPVIIKELKSFIQDYIIKR